jgi:hypothetical protein
MTSTSSQQTEPENKKPTVNTRRNLISLASAAIFATPPLLIINPEPSVALQSKNDNLCGTGFFEHFQEYRCTAIGDISDEGLSKEMKDSEIGLTDSLMGKLGVSSDDLKNAFDDSSPGSVDSKSKFFSEANSKSKEAKSGKK